MIVMNIERLKSRDIFWGYLEEELSTRSFRALKLADDIVDFDTFLQKDISYWKGLKNIGEKSIEEIVELQSTLRKRNLESRKVEKIRIQEKSILDLKDEDFFLYLGHSLSNRAINRLKKTGIVRDFPSLLKLSENGIWTMHGVGIKTANEIKEYQAKMIKFFSETEKNLSDKRDRSDSSLRTKVLRHWKSYEVKKDYDKKIGELIEIITDWIETEDWNMKILGKTPEQVLHDEDFIYTIFASVEVYKVLKKTIYGLTDKKWPISYGEIQYSLCNGISQEFVECIPLRKAINELIEEGEIEKTEFGYITLIPCVRASIHIDKKLNNRAKSIITERLQGKTLVDIGRKYDLTRERVRQYEKRFLSRKKFVKEDRFKDMFVEYDFSRETMEVVFGIDSMGYRYLDLKYKKGEKSPTQAIEDESIPIRYRKKLRQLIFSNCIEIDGVYIQKKRKALVDFFIRCYCGDEISIKDFVKNYNTFLQSVGIKTDKSLMLTYDRNVENRISNRSDILWKYGKKLRYYDTRNVNIVQFIKDFHIEEFKEQNVEISSQLFIDQFPTVANEYDIRDAYEFHNLLKKRLIEEQLSYLHLSIERMPNLCFGKPNRENQVVRLLEEYGTISCNDFVKEYRKNYGVEEKTFLANYSSYIRKYLCKGDFYSVKIRKMTEYEQEKLRGILTRPYYIMAELRYIFESTFPNSVGLLNRYNLDELGFSTNDNTVYSKSYQNFLEAMILSNSKRGIIELNQWEGQLRTYLSVRAQQNLDVIEFESGRYIMLSKLEEVGFTRDKLLEVSREVLRQVDEDYFTVKSFRRAGGRTSVDCLGFDDGFLVSLLRYGDMFQSMRHGNTWIFYHGCDSISFEGFLEDFLEKIHSIEKDEILTVLKEIYGLCYKDVYKIIEVVNKNSNDMYYNDIMSRIYRDYDVYFQEV